jgi:flavin-binding protein dodecin
MPTEVKGGVVKVIELVGSSPDSFSDAVRNAVKTASQTIRNIRGVEVMSSTAEVDDSGNLSNYKVDCKIAFLVDAGSLGNGG